MMRLFRVLRQSVQKLAIKSKSQDIKIPIHKNTLALDVNIISILTSFYFYVI